MLEPVVTYEDALDPSKPPLFDEFEQQRQPGRAHDGRSATSTPCSPRPTGCSAPPSACTVTTRCRWSAAARSPTGTPRRSSSRSTRRRSRRTCSAMLLPPQIGIPMENIRVLAGDVGGGFGLKNGVGREDVAVVGRSSIDLGRPVKWIEDRLEHLATGGQAREEMADVEVGDHRRRRAPRRPDGREGEPRRLPGRPVPGLDDRVRDARLLPGPAQARGDREQRQGASSPTRRRTSSYRGPWAIGRLPARAPARPHRPRARHRPARDPAPQLRGARRAAARHAQRASRSSASPPTSRVEQAADLVGWDAFRERQRAAPAEGRYLGIGIGVVPRGGARARRPRGRRAAT